MRMDGIRRPQSVVIPSFLGFSRQVVGVFDVVIGKRAAHRIRGTPVADSREQPPAHDLHQSKSAIRIRRCDEMREWKEGRHRRNVA